MDQEISIQRVDALRAAARSIVRDLGFMQKGLAGTALSPSAVHAIVELGNGMVTTATDLGDLLHLEKSSVSRLVQKLTREDLIKVTMDPADKRTRQLGLTNKGRKLLFEVENFGRQQLKSALDRLTEHDVGQIDTGLNLFAAALRAENNPNPINADDIEVFEGYRPGVIASVAHLHATYYSANYGFGAVFERKVATEMSEFMGRIDNPLNNTISAMRGNDLLGSVSIDGEDLGDGISHLRWYIVNPETIGLGIGSILLERAMRFVDEAGFGRTRLWTFKGLDAARHLYEKHGFALIHETPGMQWGTKVIEQTFERKRTGLLKT